MKRNVILLCSLLLLCLLIGCSNKGGGESVNQANTIEGIIEGEDIMNELFVKNFKPVYKQFSDELKNIVSLKEFEKLIDEFIKGESSFVLASRSLVNDYDSYVWKNDNKDKGILAVIDNNGIILGFQVLQLQSHKLTDELFSEVLYNLPFEDEWYVYWGGHDALINYHYEYEHIRYAYDFIKVENNYSYKGDPLNNESYFAFNQPIVAPAAGKVIKVVNDIPDNTPGQFNEQYPEGNMVMIEHEHGEISLIAHFKQHSIVVQEGDIVENGQMLGKTGNSGYSSEPHIHFQVNKKLDNNSEVVIPIKFVNGESWIKGQLAKNK